MKRITFCLLAISLFSSVAFSQNYLVKFDDACMDRLEYKSTSTANPYISYSSSAVSGTVLIFDIGLVKSEWTNKAPDKWIACRDFTPDENTIRQINDGKAKLVILNQDGTRYQYLPVDKVTLFSHKANVMKVVSADASFSVQTDNLVSGQNLASDASSSEVFVEGTLKIQCANGLILRKKDKKKSESYKELVVIPGLGIVEKRASSGSGFFSDAVTTGLKLNTIDGMDFHEYLTVYCDNLQASYYDGTSNKPVADYSSLVSRTDSVPASYIVEPCAPSTVNGIHVVQKGETLYGIARRYGLALNELRAWNGLTGTDIISICQQLKVKETAVATNPTGTPATGFPATNQPTAGTGTYWMNAPEVHVVRPGETVAMLANLYGYTEARFRKMNSLGSNEQIYTGQKLHSNDCVCPTLESTTLSQPLPYETQPSAKEATSKDNGSDVFFRPIKVHTVSKNETLFSIAKLYDTTPERILELNGLQKGEDIQLNQRLYVQ